MKIRVHLLLLAAFYGALVNPVRAQDKLAGRTLIEALRQGGYNIYFRHAATDWSQEDHVAARGDWLSCDPGKMRQLSAEGRAAAQRIGRAIRRLGIPVGRVFSSEYCRTQETARQLGLGQVTPTLAVMNMRAAQFVGGREAVIGRARRALSTPPRKGTNTVFVAHGNLMQAVSGAYTGEAGAAVFLPQANGGFRLVAKLAADDWDRLARELDR